MDKKVSFDRNYTEFLREIDQREAKMSFFWPGLPSRRAVVTVYLDFIIL